MYAMDDALDDEMPSSLRDMLANNSNHDFTEDLKLRGSQIMYNGSQITEFNKGSQDLFDDRYGVEYSLGEQTKELSKGSTGYPLSNVQDSFYNLNQTAQESNNKTNQ